MEEAEKKPRICEFWFCRKPILRRQIDGSSLLLPASRKFHSECLERREEEIDKSLEWGSVVA